MRKIFSLFVILSVIMISCINILDVQDVLSDAALPNLKDGKMIQVSSYDTTGGNNDRINIHKDKTATIAEIEGPGIITRIWVTIDSRDPFFLRRILLRMYWDGEEYPSVEVPVGDFFGTGFGYKHYISEYTGMTSGGYYCYFPMPFNKSARIEVVNQTGQEIFAFYYHIDYFKSEKKFDKKTAYFHCLWNRDIRTDYEDNYVVLEAEGKGHFVGLNMSMQPYGGGSLFYLEGDEMVYVDGEKFPSIYGTGTEDYFTSGWYFNSGEFYAPYHGLIIKDDSTGRIAAYRHHIKDPIPFTSSMKFTIEHGHANEEIADYSSTAYWYQFEPHKKFPEILGPGLRIPIRMEVPNNAVEAEELTILSNSLIYEKSDMSEYGAEWSSLYQLEVSGKETGDFSLTIPNLNEIAYDIDLYYTSGPDYGIIQIIHESNIIKEFDSYSDNIHLSDKLSLNAITPHNNNINLLFRIKDKNIKSMGYKCGLDAFILHPKRIWIPEWNIIGPFINKRESDILRFGIDSVFPPERELDFSKSYTGINSKQVKWKKYITPENGYFPLWDKMDPYEFVVCYAACYIYSPDTRTVPLLFSSDDGAKVFLNGKELYRFLEVRISSPDDDEILLDLKRGWNKLLLKIENNFGGYSFYARIPDPKNELEFSLSDSPA